MVAAAGLCLAGAVCPGQDAGGAGAIRLLVRDASRALQSGNAPLFLALFDPHAMADFGRFGDEIFALAAQRRIASSVKSDPPQGGPEECTVRVDWLLDLTPKLDPGPVERRHETVVVGLRRRGKRWRIVDVEPREFFAASARAPR